MFASARIRTQIRCQLWAIHRLIGEDVRYGPRPHRTSPPFPGLEDELEAGEPMRVDRLFPVLYP